MKELRALRKDLEESLKPGNDGLVDAVFALLESQAARCDRLEKENQRLRERIAELEKQLGPPQGPSSVEESYSLVAEEKRRQRKEREKKRRPKRKPGRKPEKDKMDCVRWVDIVPDDQARAAGS